MPVADTDIAAPAAAAETPQQALRALGSRAHQVHAATRAADHFVSLGIADDRNTGCWLMSCAVDLAAEITNDIDAIARSLRDAPADATLAQTVQRLRVRAHQLHAAARGADHFLDLDHRADRETGCWLIACAHGLAEKLATEIDDGAGTVALRRVGHDGVIDADESARLRRVSHASARGVA